MFRLDISTLPIAEIERLTGVTPIRESGALHHLDEDYFKRIEAVEFAVKYDDGKDPRDFLRADVLPLDVSRTSKTPLGLFLANKNLKVVNLPLTPETYLPKQLFEMDPKETVDLTNNPNILNGVRKERTHVYRSSESTPYPNTEKIRQGPAFANDPCQKLGCIVTNVASLSIEKTASVILNTLNLEDHSYHSTEASKG